MTTLNRSTCRRLQKLPQISSVWEGDRRAITPRLSSDTESTVLASVDEDLQGECILWIDGSEGIVRAMDVVTPETGPEAIVRTLVKAMEHPHGPARPARPQKIVVRDREIQFYLRGVLQDLEIAIEYAPNLPLIDQLFSEFQTEISARPPQLPPQFAKELLGKAQNIWRDAPWEILGEHQIISIEINRWDVNTLYASIMGMLGEEYGILFYRSLESLQQFRASVLAHESIERLEEAFLKQDCLFVTFELSEDALVDEEDDNFNLGDLPWSDIHPNFGILHPLEGLRPVLYEEETLVTIVALESLHRFFKASRKKLSLSAFPALSNRYRLTLPEFSEAISVKVETLPEVSAELFSMSALDADDDEEGDDWDFPMPPLLRDDLLPDNAFRSIGAVPWEAIELLRQSAATHQAASGKISATGDGLPVIMIQTSRPKAKALIENIQAAGGLKGIGFNPGEDPYNGDRFDLGIFQTGDGELYLFDEFEMTEIHTNARKKWDDRCKKTKGYCGLIVAMGRTGASKGNPQLKDMLALFEARSLSAKDLGLGILQRLPLNF